MRPQAAAWGSLAWRPEPPTLGPSLWLWTTAAPASGHASADSTIPSTVRGTLGFLSFGVPPLRAASMMIGVASSALCSRSVRLDKARLVAEAPDLGFLAALHAEGDADVLVRRRHDGFDADRVPGRDLAALPAAVHRVRVDVHPAALDARREVHAVVGVGVVLAVEAQGPFALNARRRPGARELAGAQHPAGGRARLGMVRQAQTA